MTKTKSKPSPERILQRGPGLPKAALIFALIGNTVLHASVPILSAPLTAEELFRPALFSQAKLSPDGKHLGAIVADHKDLKSLLVFDLATYQPEGLRGAIDFDISTFRWLDDNRVLFDITQDKLFSVGLYTAKLGELRQFAPINTYDVTRIIGVPRARPGTVLVWTVQLAGRFNLGRPGDLAELEANRAGHYYTDTVIHTYAPPAGGTVLDWQANQEGELALCYTWANGQVHAHRYQPTTKTWRDTKLNLDEVKPMQLDLDDRFLWVVTHSEKAGYELRRYDLDTGVLAAPIYADSRYDISAGWLHFSEAEHALVGVTYMQRKSVTIWFSKDYAAIQAAIDLRSPDTDNILVDHDRADRKFLFRVAGAQTPGSYELFDRETKLLRTISDTAPWLKDRPLRPVEAVAFHTRDGVELEGYLTLPDGASKEHPVPLVVLAHGGPWVRDTPAFNPEVQFLACRGYAVLQPNYRGSTGYSPEISLKYEFDFRRMHDDVTDATKAILHTGLIEPKRVAIMGGSFGGYLALAGVAFEDKLYRCAITEDGVFDWERQVKSKSPYGGPSVFGRPGEYEILKDKLGKPGLDHAYFEWISPLAHADQIHVPVLIAHGDKDGVVDIAQSKQLASVLKEHGVPCETFYRYFEGHGFSNYENRVEYYHRVEAFLAANLGGLSLTPAK